ncbi:hypothetical protein [Brevibacillus sp. 179-C9.3 HS]|uniref:hypothetical protein n=1 Tax=unclassified Brevibacillus TaxID=2684853 RepID=UPI0039A0D025
MMFQEYNDEKGWKKYCIIINGETLDITNTYVSSLRDRVFSLHSYDYEDSLKIADTYSFRELVFNNSIVSYISNISLFLPIEGVEFSDYLRIISENDTKLRVCHEFKIDDFEHWKKPWSIAEYAKVMKEFTTMRGLSWDEDEVITNGFSIIWEIDNLDMKVRDFYERSSPIAREIHDQSIVILRSQSSPNTLVSLFSFPEHIKIACEQYLLFFVTFLKEIGINATGDLVHQAGDVLFSITPESKEIALEQIQRALQIYLQLPENPAFQNYQLTTNDMNVQQLIATIQHFQSQLMFYQSMLQLQQATIQAQQSTIDVYLKTIGASHVSNNIQPISTYVKQISDGQKVEDNISFLGGNVSLTKYQGNGFEIDLPRLYNLVKEWVFKKKN